MQKLKVQQTKKPSGKNRGAMQPSVPADKLKQTYGVFGHFSSAELASKKVVEVRKVSDYFIK